MIGNVWVGDTIPHSWDNWPFGQWYPTYPNAVFCTKHNSWHYGTCYGCLVDVGQTIVTPPPASTTAASLLEKAKARLAELDKEREVLQRMIAAAEKK